MNDFKHIPVLLNECIDALKPEPNMVVVDATIGGAGHSREIVKHIAGGTLIGLDRDNDALRAAADILQEVKNVSIHLIKCNFADIEDNLRSIGIDKVDAILADFGVSSWQIDNPERGFSYASAKRRTAAEQNNGGPADAPLDMRMDTDQDITAADIVNGYSAAKLADIIFNYGEERYSRRIADAIVKSRPIKTTLQLAEIISAAVPAGYGKTGGHPAKRTFQAIRIEVNQELESIRKFLTEAINCLRPSGRLAVITFHSLEDRIVKWKFKAEAADCLCPPDIPQCVCGHKATVKLLTKKPIIPTIKEVKNNPRSASAKLRIVVRTGQGS
jgi:16S rRNA (cytosine1402-N4)-methyltransferase